VLGNKEENRPTCSLRKTIIRKRTRCAAISGWRKRSLDPLEEIMNQVQTHYPMENYAEDLKGESIWLRKDWSRRKKMLVWGMRPLFLFFTFNFNARYKGVVTRIWNEKWKERKVSLWDVKLFYGKTSSPSFFHETFNILSLFHKIFEEKDREELRWLVRHKWREGPNRTESSKLSKRNMVKTQIRKKYMSKTKK